MFPHKLSSALKRHVKLLHLHKCDYGVKELPGQRQVDEYQLITALLGSLYKDNAQKR